MRVRSCVLAGVLATAGMLAVAPPPSGAAQVDVAPGGSIQAALDAAAPGDHVRVAPGTYAENLEITKPVTLEAAGVILVPPATPRETACSQPGENGGPTTFPGLCIHGQLDAEGNVVSYVQSVVLEGIAVRHFSGDGAFAIGAEDFGVHDARFSRNAGYGIFALRSHNVHFHDSFAYFNGDAGFYVGESPEANVKIEGNHSYANQAEGILFRDAQGGEISDNIVDRNCAGIFVLDTGAPGAGGDVTVEGNHVHGNNAVCEGEEGEAPPFSGIGVGLLGAYDTEVEENVIERNVAAGPSGLPTGGLIMIDTSSFGGTAPTNNEVEDNWFMDNDPDIFWDGSGTGNEIEDNGCTSSVPPGLCG
jgi:nitrous oxidase accessory protein NosD